MSGVIWILLFAVEYPAAAQTAKQQPNAFTGNIFCGPRCVQRVVEYYDKSADLNELIHEIQWPAMEQGASLESLAAALQSRGIYTAAVDVDRSMEISWDHPVIVHLAYQNQEHYVVWLPPPTPGGAGRIWDGARSRALLPGEFNSLRSGPALLTSAAPISDSQVVSHPRRDGSPGGRNAAILAIVAIVAFTCGFALPQKK